MDKRAIISQALYDFEHSSQSFGHALFNAAWEAVNMKGNELENESFESLIGTQWDCSSDDSKISAFLRVLDENFS